jgi:hypothetical protein
MKKITLLIALAIFSFCWQSSAQIQVGDETGTTTLLPITSCYAYTYSQQIFLASEINSSGNITSLSFYLDPATSTASFGNSVDWVVYLGHTSKTSFASTSDWDDYSNLTQSYSGVVTFPAEDNWFTITLDTPFAYNGTDNLILAVDENTSSWNCTMYWQKTDTPDDKGIYYRSDSTNPDPASPPATATGIVSYRTNTIFGGLAPSTDTLDYYNLQWPATGSINAGDEFNVYAQAYSAGLTDVTAGQAPGISCWIGYSSTDTDPSGADFTWIPAGFDSEQGNNDQYILDLGAEVTPAGTYYYASRWSLNGGPYTYGGIQSDGSYGGIWGDDNNISGVLTVTGPANDECSGAIALTVNSDLECGTVTSGTTFGASPSAEDSTGVSGTPNTDVWYSFVATTPYHQVTLSNVTNLGGGTSTSTDMGMTVYDATGGCAALTFVATSDPNTMNVTGLTVSSVYYVRVYGWQSGIQNNSFDICVGTLPDPPVNDDCLGAIPITESTDLSCDIIVSGTTVDAYASNEDDCSTSNKDVWYVMTASQTNTYKLTVTETTDYGFSSTYVSIFEGSCGALTQVGTACFSTTTNVDLTSGSTYYINVRSTSSTSGVDFDLCVAPYPPAPGNDECATAFAFNESPDFNCSNVISGTTVSASASSEDDCSTSNKDVWYEMTAAQTDTYKFTVSETQDFGSSSTYVSVFEGACGSLTQVGASCFSSSIEVDLTAGNTYYINVRSTSSTEGVNFELCAFPLPPAPDNDDCAGAFVLNESTDASCNNIVFGTTVSATASSEDDCSTTNKDVWYTIMPSTTSDYLFTVSEIQDFGSSSTYVSIFEGGCGTLTQVGSVCSSSAQTVSLISGNTYYVNVRSTSSTEGVNFSLCALPVPATAPVNDDCSGAIALTPGAIFSDYPVDGTVIGATADAEDVDNCGQPGPGVWYSVVVPADGNITIETGPDSATDSKTFDSVIEAFTGTCGALTAIECDDDDAATFNFSMMNLTSLTPGSTIYIRVWEYDGNEFEPFSISAYNSTLSNIETEVVNNFKYFPNPVNDKLTLNAQSNIQNVAVYNMLGQEVINASPNTLDAEVDMVNLNSGAYFVKVTIDNATKTIRVIKN